MGGAWQRLADYSIFVWIFALAYLSQRYPL